MGNTPISIVQPQDSAVSASGGVWSSQWSRIGREMFSVASKTVPRLNPPTIASTGIETVISLLRLWREEDPDEQRETLDYLMKALDEDRLSNRKLFA